MNTNLFKALQKPELYTKTEGEFWNDEYISAQMLKAHIDPEFDGASRRHSFIDKSVEWISKTVSPDGYPTLLDIGCGPGMYCERFAKKGYHVTGVDFSKRSINYAKDIAEKENSKNTYIYQNYLKLDLNQTFDFCTLIYCDYGALSTDDRKTVLKKVYDHLKPGGKFLFDVFTMVFYDQKKEQNSWYTCEKDGFWRADEHIVIDGTYKYNGHILLDMTNVIAGDQLSTYYLWDTCYTREDLVKEVKDAGFKVCDVYGDVAGAPYEVSSPTMAILLEKN